MAKINFGGVEENVVKREEFPLSKARDVLKDEVIAIIGYGVQGPALVRSHVSKTTGTKLLLMAGYQEKHSFQLKRRPGKPQ